MAATTPSANPGNNDNDDTIDMGSGVIKTRRTRWPDGVKTTAPITEINDYILYKLVEYRAYDLNNDDM